MMHPDLQDGPTFLVANHHEYIEKYRTPADKFISSLQAHTTSLGLDIGQNVTRTKDTTSHLIAELGYSEDEISRTSEASSKRRLMVYKLELVQFGLPLYFVMEHTPKVGSKMMHGDNITSATEIMRSMFLGGDLIFPLQAVVGVSHIGVPAVNDNMKDLAMGKLLSPNGILKPFEKGLTLSAYLKHRSKNGEIKLFNKSPSPTITEAIILNKTTNTVDLFS